MPADRPNAPPLPANLDFVRRLRASWRELADILEIEPHERDRFPRGDEAREIWEWCADRQRLDVLPPSLDAIGRSDLAEPIRRELARRRRAELDELLPPEPGPVSGDVAAVRVPSRWSLRDDPDLATHWLPRARGADPDTGGAGWSFTGRQVAIARIAAYLGGAAPRVPLVVTGEPGCGKSSLLAHVVTLADPDIRERMPGRYRPAFDARLVGAVDVAIRATGKTAEQVVAEIADAAGIGGADRDRLVVTLHARPGGFGIVLDALDEADPDAVRPIATLLRRLSRDPDGRGVRVVVSVRRAPAGTTLHDITHVVLGMDRAIVIDADRAPYLEIGDVAKFVRDRLDRQRPGAHGSPYLGDHPTTTRVAAAVATRSGGNFLVAQLTSRDLAERDEPVDVRHDRWWATFPTDVESAMDQYIARFGDERRQRRVRELLTPLAFAAADGLPDNWVWTVAATALSNEAILYQDKDIHAVIDDASTYLVITDRPGRRTYRLFHDALAQYLRARCRHPNPEAGLVAVWRSMVRAGGTTGSDWAAADRYLLEHLARHAARADVLDDLLDDPRFVVSADPGGLVPALPRVRTAAGRAVARAYRYVPPDVAGAAELAAYIALSAQQWGDSALRDRYLRCGLDLPWRVTDGAWLTPDAHELADRVEETSAAVVLLPGPDTSVIVASADRDGYLTVREVGGGVSEVIAKVASGTVTALAGTSLPDGRHLVCAGLDDGRLRLWHLDAGLAVPFGPGGGPLRDRVSALSVAWTPTGPVIAARDGADTLAVLGVDDGGSLDVVAVTHVAGVRHVAVVPAGDRPPSSPVGSTARPFTTRTVRVASTR